MSKRKLIDVLVARVGELVFERDQALAQIAAMRAERDEARADLNALILDHARCSCGREEQDA